MIEGRTDGESTEATRTELLDEAAGTKTVEPKPDARAMGIGEDAPSSPSSITAGADLADVVKDRFAIPLLLPILSILAVALLVLNISRVFLAGDSTSALILGITITLTILGGASLLAALPHLRTSSLVMVMGLAAITLIFGGLVSLGPSLNNSKGKPSAGYQAPTGPAVDTLRVTAEASLKFDATAYSVKPGIVQVVYGGASGHTLVIDDPRYSGFQLALPAGPKTGKVDLPTGNYTIYCSVPGHRAAGMEAIVNASGSAPSAGATTTTQ